MPLEPSVEAEEKIYSFTAAGNGAGPLWCHGSTVVVRQGEEVFVAALETLPDQQPLCNCRWLLYQRTAQGWTLIHRDDSGRTREPSPIVLSGANQLLVSANPTRTEPGTYNGPAQPTAFRFSTTCPQDAPKIEHPRWQGEPAFTEHSYRTVTADADQGEVLYMQNVGYDVSHMSFRDHAGCWHGLGTLRWPYGAEYDPPQPLRLCYPNVMLRKRAAHFFGVGDIVEPVAAWRQAKLEITQRKWDYVFRRLFYAYTPDITTTPFGTWIEVANRDATAGAMRNGDVYVDASGVTHLIWCETSVDARIRDRFFPHEAVIHTLEYMSLRDGVELTRRTLARREEGESGPRPQLGRFHVLADGTLVVLASFHRDREDGPLRVYRLGMIPQADAETQVKWVDIPFAHPLADTFLTNTVRGGSEPSDTIDLVGMSSQQPLTLAYAQVRVR